MNRCASLLLTFLVAVLLIAGCSGNATSPVTPGHDDLIAASLNANSTQTHLWGYYDVYIDIPTQTATAVPNRGMTFSANVVSFVNKSAAGLGFNINDTPTGPDYIDVDIDVSITHPFPGLTQYNGYDVRGVFIGEGAEILSYNNLLTYATHASPLQQEMYDYNLTAADPHPGTIGNPDGYTRWFNPTEFMTPGLFGYTPGKVATPGYTGAATLNPYKYFADGLPVDGEAWNFLATDTNFGVFSAGSTNTRNYYLRFPIPNPSVKFNYAIVASWKGEKPEDHPANAPEACGISVSVTPDLYYVSNSEKGGKLKLDISLPTNWGQLPSTIFIESTVLSTPHQMANGSAEMIPVGGGPGYSTWHVAIPADNITGNSSTVYHEFWVIPQYDDLSYKNDFGVTNACGEDKLAAFFRHELFVSSVPGNLPPIAALATPPAAKVWDGQTIAVTFDASASTDPNPGDIPFLSFEWDLNYDGIFGDPIDGGTPIKPVVKFTSAPPSNKVAVKVTDPMGEFDTAETTVDLTWLPVPKGKDINGDSATDQPLDLCIDPTTGDCLVIYSVWTGTWNAYVRRYKFDDGYNSYTQINLGTNGDYFGRIDCNPDGYWFVMALLPSSGGTWYWRAKHYSPNDNLITTSNGDGHASGGSIGYYTSGHDAVAMMNTTGPRAKDHVCIPLPVYGSPTTYYVFPAGREDTAFTAFWHSSLSYGGFTPGCSYLSNTGYIRAAEAETGGPYIWFLKNGPLGDTLCNRWDASGTTLTYANGCIGTGNQGSADNTWRDGRDVTIGEQDTLYILDYDNGTTRIKGFRTSDNSPVGSIVVNGLIYQPERLDGSKDLGFLVMLEGYGIQNSTNLGRLYVFTDAETPPS